MGEARGTSRAGGWAADGATDVGLVRSRNEDAFAVDAALGCYLVADGLGGHRGGDVASRLARDAVLETVRRERDTADVAATLERAVRTANRRILQAARSDPALAGMGTTLSVLWLESALRARAAHVGDSRIYRLEPAPVDGPGAAGLAQLTEDHTWAMEMVRAGRITLAEAERSIGWHQLTRAVGLDDDVAVDVLAVELADAEGLLLCTDGLTGMLEEAEIARLLRERAPEPRAACEALIDAAVHRGAHDNVTVVVAFPSRGS